MEYLRVKKKYDNTTLFTRTGKRYHINSLKTILVGSELITLKEAKRYKIDQTTINICTEKVNINKNKTYFFFGARFEKGKGYN